MADQAGTETKDRAASLLATRQAKMDLLFKGQHYDVIKEIHLEGDQRFQTPFGNKGRHGYALRLTEGSTPAEGAAAAAGGDGSQFVVGDTMLEQIAKEYGAVEVPAKERKRRTKEQKAADDAAAAEAKANAKSEGSESS